MKARIFRTIYKTLCVAHQPPPSPSPSTTPVISLASVSLSGPLSALVKLVPGWSQMLKPCPLCRAFAGLHSPLTPSITTPPSPSVCSNLSSPTWVNQQPHIIPKSPPILWSWHDQCFLFCSAFFFPRWHLPLTKCSLLYLFFMVAVFRSSPPLPTM